MKPLLSLLILLTLNTAFAQEISFEEQTIDFGTIERGSDGNRVFSFTNSGVNDLMIESIFFLWVYDSQKTRSTNCSR